MSNGVRQRGTTHSHNGVTFVLPSDQKDAPAPAYAPLAAQNVAENGNMTNMLGKVPGVFEAIEKYGGRRLSLWGGVDLNMALAGPVAEEAMHYSGVLTWLRLAIAALFFVLAVAFSFVTPFEIKNDGKYPLYWDPITFNKLDNKWETALEGAGSIFVSWMLVAMLYAFAAYHALHFVPFIANIYNRFVFGMRMNPIRWLFHGAAGGLILGAFGLIMGVSNVIVFVFLVLTVLVGAACILFMELINRPTVSADYDATIDNDYITIEGTPMAVRYSEINPWPYVIAVIALAAYVGITWSYFWHAVANSSHNVPWFAWAVAIVVPIIFALMAIVNGLRYLVSWTLFKYFYIDVAHVVLVDGGVFVCSAMVLIGMALL